MISMVEYVHQRMKEYDGELAVDFTMGNGYDTLFMAKCFPHIIAFDVQEEALIRTQERLSGYDNVMYVLDNHSHLDWYIDRFDVGVFNLGYLPKSKSSVTTEVLSTRSAITKALERVNKVLFVVVYPGHQQGYEESLWIDDYVSHLGREFNVSCFKMMNKNKSPYVIEIEKRL